MMKNAKNPRIRTLNALPAKQGNRQMVLLQDPLGIAKKSVLIPPKATPLLMLCDGTRSLQEVQSAFFSMYGLDIKTHELEGWLDVFDDAAFLDNEEFQRRKKLAEKDFRAASSRSMTLADEIYPSTQEDLSTSLDAYLAHTQSLDHDRELTGMICPHIDYARGWRVYAEVMARARKAINDAELIIVLGTDHFDDGNPLSMTQQSYKTPYGVLPTNIGMVKSLHDSIPEIDIFQGELRHRFEHSIELALIWLHHMRAGSPVEVLPILCGTHDLYFEDEMQAEKSWVSTLVSFIREISKRQKTLLVAAADLAHVGVAFGGEEFHPEQRAEVALADEQLLQRVKEVDPQGFIGEIMRVKDRYNVCGITPIYLLLQVLSPATADIVSYELCPADHQGTSWVSICGALLG
jgi:AmmeMemoRadiSam system protein B